ncbi:MAG: hypothetical protein KF760_06255 [Candidatus Eremiobacteraeota bacterium]|nr:hypothetical protein [Candidatus Eremiobacteraeota bacterium]MCW5866140.1 hypothetical protein [Candidatus Eremiobacteraeota bacterium]
MKRILFWLGFLLCLGVPAGLVVYQENMRRGSVVVYLRLAPSGVTLYGDRAELAYDLNLRPLDPGWPQQGFLRLDLDSRRVVNAWAPDAHAPPGQRIRYRLGNSQVLLEGTSLSVPPGRSEEFRQARYAKFDLSLDGKLTLRGLTNMSMDQL